MNWCANNKVFISRSRSLTAEALVQLILHCVVTKCSRRFRFVPGRPVWSVDCSSVTAVGPPPLCQSGDPSSLASLWGRRWVVTVNFKSLTGWWRDWHQKKMWDIKVFPNQQRDPIPAACPLPRGLLPVGHETPRQGGHGVPSDKPLTYDWCDDLNELNHRLQ